MLKDKGIDIDVVNARFIKPFDSQLLEEIKNKRIFTLEDGVKTGGFGEGVVAYYSERNIDADVTVFAFDEKPYPQGSVEFIMKKTATDPTSLAEKIYAKVKA